MTRGIFGCARFRREFGAYRDAEMRRSPERLRAIEEALHDGYQMPISGLAEAEVGRMVEARSDQSASAEFVAQLHRATAGNPLFVKLAGSAVSIGSAISLFRFSDTRVPPPSS